MACDGSLPGHVRSLASWPNLHDEVIIPLSDVTNRAATGVLCQLTQVVRLYMYEQSRHCSEALLTYGTSTHENKQT